MSSQQQRVVAIYTEQQLLDYVAVSASAFTEEVSVIWRRKWTGMTLLFAFTRYIALFLQILSFMPNPTYISCFTTAIINETLNIILWFCFADGNRLVSGIVFALSFVQCATNLARFQLLYRLMRVPNAQLPKSKYEAYCRLAISTRTALTIADIVVLVVTWSKTIHAYIAARKLNIGAPLASMLLRDGTIYFLILLVLNVLQSLPFYAPSLDNIQFASAYYQALVPTLVCRFILNLRQAGTDNLLDQQSRSTSLVGNLGQSLQFRSVHDEEDEHNGENTGTTRAALESTVTEA
ncbi:hypothetical protein BC629DRAFT_1442232 [Irpex lacteus]|nr:hypothetical protein BC629DRAFT_1442232 [Irpex lacteus]